MHTYLFSTLCVEFNIAYMQTNIFRCSPYQLKGEQAWSKMQYKKYFLTDTILNYSLYPYV
jgi:hypothetical protein